MGLHCQLLPSMDRFSHASNFWSFALPASRLVSRLKFSVIQKSHRWPVRSSLQACRISRLFCVSVSLNIPLKSDLCIYRLLTNLRCPLVMTGFVDWVTLAGWTDGLGVFALAAGFGAAFFTFPNVDFPKFLALSWVTT